MCSQSGDFSDIECVNSSVRVEAREIKSLMRELGMRSAGRWLKFNQL